MRMLDEIALLGVARTQDANGYPVESPSTRTVYADIRSVGYREFYAAQADVNRPEIIFLINPDEYDGQTKVAYGGKNYRVIRPYTPPRGYTELHCVRE